MSYFQLEEVSANLRGFYRAFMGSKFCLKEFDRCFHSFIILFLILQFILISPQLAKTFCCSHSNFRLIELLVLVTL